MIFRQNTLNRIKNYICIHNTIVINIFCSIILWSIFIVCTKSDNALFYMLLTVILSANVTLIIFAILWFLFFKNSDVDRTSLLKFRATELQAIQKRISRSNKVFSIQLQEKISLSIAISSAIILMVNMFRDSIWIEQVSIIAVFIILLGLMITIQSLQNAFILHVRLLKEQLDLLKNNIDVLQTEIERRQKETDRRGHAVAAYIAGNLLLYSALDQSPDEFYAVIYEPKSQSENLGGSINAKINNELRSTIIFTEWSMATLLVGKIAETLLCSESEIVNATHNHHQWFVLAKNYLSATDKTYTIEPQNESETRHNEAKLKALEFKQINQLEHILKDNINILKAVADELFNKKRLNKSEIQPFLNRVRLPENFPRPKMHSKKLETGDLVA